MVPPVYAEPKLRASTCIAFQTSTHHLRWVTHMAAIIMTGQEIVCRGHRGMADFKQPDEVQNGKCVNWMGNNHAVLHL